MLIWFTKNARLIGATWTNNASALRTKEVQINKNELKGANESNHQKMLLMVKVFIDQKETDMQ